MLSNKELKYLKSLHQRKFRQKYANFIVEGVKMVEEILQQGSSDIEGIYALKEWIDDNKQWVVSHREKVVEVSAKELKGYILIKDS